MTKSILLVMVAVLAAGSAWAQGRATDLGKAWSPEFRVEANFTGSFIDDKEFEGELGNRAALKEAGIGFRAYVDPFFRLDVIFSGEEEAGENGVQSNFGVETAMVTWIAAPWGAEVRIGKFQTSMGEYNDGDPDEHPQVTAPDIILNLFGEDDGYIDTGISGNIYVPNPFDLSNIFWLGVFNGDNPVAFHGGRERKPTYFTRYESFWELGILTGLELGVSYVAGTNSRETRIGPETFDVRGETRMFNFHWELDYADSRRSLYSGFSLLFEYFTVSRRYFEDADLTAAGELAGLETKTEETHEGFYLLGEYRFARNWGIGGRIDSSPVLLVEFGGEEEEEVAGGGADDGDDVAGAYTIYGDENLTAYSLMVSYYPSRFSALRFQYTNRQIEDVTVNEYWVQLQVLIGFERPDVF